MSPNDMFTFLAMVVLIAVVIRSRRKVRCLEAQLSHQRPAHDIKNQAEKKYNDHRLIQVADLCRQLEAKVQNRSVLLEILIDDADDRIRQLISAEDSTSSHRLKLSSEEFKIAFMQGVEAGRNDEDLAMEFQRAPLVMTLLRDLWRKEN